MIVPTEHTPAEQSLLGAGAVVFSELSQPRRKSIRTSTTLRDRGRDAVGGSPVLGRPPATIDPDWRERIEIAKRVRDETRKARGDKPSTFDMRGPPIRWFGSRRYGPWRLGRVSSWRRACRL